MENPRSKYDSRLTLKYITMEHENLIFDRKSIMSKPSILAEDISAFANAEGGALVIGISNDKELEGIGALNEVKLNDFIEAPRTTCKPMPHYDYEFMPIINKRGEKDKLLLLHIYPSQTCLIRTAKDDTFLRIGDRSVPMKGESLRLLEYEKQLQRFEERVCEEATINDLDSELISKYKQSIAAEELSTEQVLSARGMMKQGKLTHAAVLLFASNIRKFYPNCRVRFIRYEGETALSGTNLNIIKDQSFDESIIRLIDKVKVFVKNQLRDFTALNPQTGKFETTPEYPEFAWQEGIINAITHREYALSGDYIRVIMYDDRLVIESPGKLPYPVTPKNIKTTRSSRNPIIARVLTEMGWVRELNEGVKRIYADMEALYLKPPAFKEDSESGNVRLILKNNILVRHVRFKERSVQYIGNEIWEELDDLERSIVTYMAHVTKVRTSELAKYTGYSTNTIQKRISHLIELNVVYSYGRLRDPQRYYSLVAYRTTQSQPSE